MATPLEKLPAVPIPPWLEALLPPGIRRYRVDVGRMAMQVMEMGDGPPVLLLHGNPTWGFLYRKVATALGGMRLIIPDLIGLGFSDKPTDPRAHQLEQHGRWLGALLDALGLEDLVFVGQDWGGPIGLVALAERPGLARGMVLLNTVVSEPRQGFRPTAFHRLSRFPVVSDVLFRWAGFPQNVLRFAQGDRRSIAGEVARAYRYPLRRRADRVAPLALARMVPDSFSHPSIEPLRRCRAFVEGFTGPAAVVWGDRDPVLGRVRGWVEKLLPHAEITRTQAGHFLQEEVPDEIAAAVRAVVERVARG